MSGALSGLRVWLTRPEPALTTSTASWQQHGATVFAAPTVEVRPCVPAPAERAALAAAVGRASAATDPPWALVVALPSPRAAEHFLAACGARDPEGRRWRVAALGPATARRATELGLDLVLTPERALGAVLAREIVAALHPRCVVLPSSDRRRPELGAGLRAAGVEVVDLTVHRTEPVAALPEGLGAALRAGEVDLLAVYSPSALDFVERVDAAIAELVRPVAVACLGPTTGARARARGLQVVAEPARPGEDDLLEEVARWWAARGGPVR